MLTESCVIFFFAVPSRLRRYFARSFIDRDREKGEQGMQQNSRQHDSTVGSSKARSRRQRSRRADW